MNPSDIQAVRLLRTAHSERYVFSRKGREFAALDLHYLNSGAVAGTVVVYADGGLNREEIPDFLRYVDDVLLPEVDLSDENLYFTVVIGEIVGSFSPEPAGSE